MVAGIVGNVTLDVLRGPLAYFVPKPIPELPRVYQPHRPHSANRIVRGSSARERIGRMPTIIDTYLAVVQQAIRDGNADAAYRYTRLLARHPAVKRVTA